MTECFATDNTTAKVRQLKSLFPPEERLPTDEALEFYIEAAAEIVINTAYPLGGATAAKRAKTLRRYASDQVRIAQYLVSKEGAEGETGHSENGITRNYEAGDVPKSLLSRIIPHARAFYK